MVSALRFRVGWASAHNDERTNERTALVISVELRHHANFRGDRSNRCRDIAILDFSRCRLPPSWIFKILNFLTVAMVKKVELRHCAKFSLNRSNWKRKRDLLKSVFKVRNG